MACHRPVVAFGISYRGERGRDMSSSDAGYMSLAGRTAMANAPPPPPSPGKHNHHDLQQHQHKHQRQECLFGTSADKYQFHGEFAGGGGGREDNDTVPFGDTLGCREMMSHNRPDDSESLHQAHQGGDDVSASRLPSSGWSTVDGVDGRDDRKLSVPAIVTTDDDGETAARRAEDNEGLQGSNDGDSGGQGRPTKAPEGRGGASVGVSDTGLERNELVESWLLDVRLETETAGTALRVSATVGKALSPSG